MSTANTVRVMSNQTPEQFTGSGAITPGHLCYLTSAGLIAVHATAGGDQTRLFAIEDSHQGSEITDAYVTATTVQAIHALPGDRLNALLLNGETAVIGSLLESGGDGTLRVKDADASVGAINYNSVVGYAREAVDMSGSDAVDPSARILITVL